MSSSVVTRWPFTGIRAAPAILIFSLNQSPRKCRAGRPVLLATFGFGSLDITPADFTKPDALIQLGYPPNRIDLLTETPASASAEAWTDRVSGLLDNVSVPFHQQATSIKNKKLSGRPKDLADLAALE